MKKIHLQIISALAIAFVFGILFTDNFIGQTPNKTIAEYYAILDSREKVLSGEEITSEQLASLSNCGYDLNCFEEYYEKYNASSTLEKTLSNVALLMRDHTEYADYCHFIMHGVGHAELTRQGGDVQKALKIFSDGKMYKNMSTCGSGYIHGVLEQGVKGISDKEELVEFFNKICATKEVKDVGENDCYHGLGHAATIQLEYQLPEAIYVCKKVIENTGGSVNDEFNCYTGVFMEGILGLPSNEVLVKNGENFEFPMCDALTNELERQACFFESVIEFRKFVEKGPNGKANFSDMTLMCKIFGHDLYRALCIRNIAIRSITENRETNLQKMCIDNTNSRAERIVCVLGFAHRLALALDSTKGVEYVQTYTDICKILPKNEAVLCVNIIKESPGKAYWFGYKDLDL